MHVYVCVCVYSCAHLITVVIATGANRLVDKTDETCLIALYPNLLRRCYKYTFLLFFFLKST